MPGPRRRWRHHGRQGGIVDHEPGSGGSDELQPGIGAGCSNGQIVREIDALGGAMGRAIDATGIQFRM